MPESAISSMNPGFQEREITVASSDGRDDRLIDSLHFLSNDGTLYRVPAGSTTDGMSTPPLVNAIPGFEPYGRHWFSAVLHDAAYRGTLERLATGRWVPAKLSRLEADELFREALAGQGVGALRRSIIFHALRLFGAGNFKTETMANFHHQQDDTGGLLSALLGVIALVAIVAVIAWIGKNLSP